MGVAADERAPDILVAVDGKESRDRLRGVLEADGCDVRFASEAEPVVRLLERDGSPDVMVLEAPAGRVRELCRRVRRRFADLRLVLICEADALEDRVAGLRAGADDYVGKPFAADEVAARVHVLLRRDGLRRMGAAVLRHGTIRLDGATRQATQREEPVGLTKTEFDLLELFLRHPGEVLMRWFIYERVWGHDGGFSANSLEVYVSSLRRKLEREGAPRVIRTVRGIGYVLDPA
jgi:two-component system response regulator MprA